MLSLTISFWRQHRPALLQTQGFPGYKISPPLAVGRKAHTHAQTDRETDTHTHKNTHTNTHTNTLRKAHTHKHTHTNTHKHAHSGRHTHIYTHTHPHPLTLTNTHTLHTHPPTHPHTYTYTHTHARTHAHTYKTWQQMTANNSVLLTEAISITAWSPVPRQVYRKAQKLRCFFDFINWMLADDNQPLQLILH